MSSPDVSDGPRGTGEGGVSPGTLLKKHVTTLVALGAFIGTAGAAAGGLDLGSAEAARSPFLAGAVPGVFFGFFFGIMIGIVVSVTVDGELTGRCVLRLLARAWGGALVGALLAGTGAVAAAFCGPAAVAWLARWPLLASQDLRHGLAPLIGGAVGGLLTACVTGLVWRFLVLSDPPQVAGRTVSDTGSSSVELTIGEFTLSLDTARQWLKPLLLGGLVLVIGALGQYWQQERQHPERGRARRHQLAVLDARMGLVDRLALSRDGRVLAAAGWPESWMTVPGRITLWELPEGRERAAYTTGHVYPINGLALSPDGRLLVSISSESVRIWEVATGREQAVLQPPVEKSYFSSVSISPDGRLLAVGSGSRFSGGRIHLWQLPSLQSRPALRAPGGASIGPVAFSPDGRTLAAGVKREIHLWDWRRGRPAGVLRGHPYEVYRLSFSADGRTLAATGNHRTVMVWDAARRKVRAKLDHGAKVTAALLSADGATLLTTCHDQKSLRRWDIGSRRELDLLAHWVPGTGAESSSVTALTAAPDGRTSASASFEHVILWRDLSVHLAADGQTLGKR